MGNELNNIAVLKSSQHYFTQDGFDLVNNYVTTLKHKMNLAEITISQQNLVMNGIYEFIIEFSTNYKNSKINFNETLELINELGSPSEIIQSFDFHKEANSIHINKVPCQFCSWINDDNAIFCEYCGKTTIDKINKQMERKSDNANDYTPLSYYKTNFKQRIIDQPYSVSFLIFAVLFTSIISLLTFQSVVFPHISEGLIFFIDIIFFILFNMVVSLLPAVIFALIAGIIIDILFKDSKSVKFRYNKIIEHFEDNVLGGFMLLTIGMTFLISILFFSFYSFFQSYIFILLIFWFILMISITILLVYYFDNSLKPKKLNLTQLSSIKLIMDQENNSKILKYNIKMIFPILLISTVFSIISFSLNEWLDDKNSLIYITFLITTLSISLGYSLNGYLLMKLYSWRRVNGKIEKKYFLVDRPDI